MTLADNGQDNDVYILMTSTTNSDVETSLENILKKVKNIDSCEDPDVDFKELLNSKFITFLSDMLQKLDDTHLSCLTLQVFAELAKTDIGRSLCINDGVIKPVLKCLSPQYLNSSHNIPFQACRVLGNMCFESDAARNLVKENKGEEILLDLLTNIASDEWVASMDNLLRVACGALINVIDDNEDLQGNVLSLGILEISSKIIRKFPRNDDLMETTLSIIEYFCDPTKEEVKRFLSTDESMDAFYVLMETTNNQEIIDSIFQILSTLVENDGAKAAVSSTDFVEKLCELVEIRQMESNVKLMELASDFIVLLLTGDESMNTLYKKGVGPVFLKIKSWLDLSKTLKLQTAAAFALCNIARSDENCIQLVEIGILDDILNHLNHYPTDSKEPVLQHALIGTLTNLAIAFQNKGKMIDKGVVEICSTYLQSESFTVIFKSLGTLRMLLNKSEKATHHQLGRDKDFLTRLDQLCSMKEHEGIRCESLRIVASIIKNCHSSEVMKTVVEHNAMHNLLDLLQSEHTIMKNEAILSLIMLSLTLGNDPLEKHKSEICERLKMLLSPSSQIPDEIVHNVLNLIKTSQTSPSMMTCFKEGGLYDILNKYKSRANEKIGCLIETIQQF